MSSRQILFVTGTRADYGKLEPLAEAFGHVGTCGPAKCSSLAKHDNPLHSEPTVFLSSDKAASRWSLGTWRIIHRLRFLTTQVHAIL